MPSEPPCLPLVPNELDSETVVSGNLVFYRMILCGDQIRGKEKADLQVPGGNHTGEKTVHKLTDAIGDDELISRTTCMNYIMTKVEEEIRSLAITMGSIRSAGVGDGGFPCCRCPITGQRRGESGDGRPVSS